MFCEKCGAKLFDDNVAFCMNCGARVNALPNTSVPEEPDTKDPVILKQRKKVCILGISGLIMSVIGWIVLSFFLFGLVFLIVEEILNISLGGGAIALVFIISLVTPIIMCAQAVTTGNKLAKINQLKGKSVAGRRCGKTGFWIAASFASIFFLVMITFILEKIIKPI